MMKQESSPAKSTAAAGSATVAFILAVAGLTLSASACKSPSHGTADGARQTDAVPGAAAEASPTATSRVQGDPYLVTFKVNGDATKIGAIQFEVKPKSGAGGFATVSGKAECDSLIGEALSAFSTHADGKLVGALVDVGGFTAPAAVARCTYLSPQAVSADAFAVNVTDASDVQAVALAPTPSVVISEVKRVE